jgi:hypothetical protein
MERRRDGYEILRISRILMVVLALTCHFSHTDNDNCSTGGPPLEDDFWHVTDYYENIRNKVLNLDKNLGSCYKNNGKLPDRICTTPLKVSAWMSWYHGMKSAQDEFFVIQNNVCPLPFHLGEDAVYTTSKL